MANTHIHPHSETLHQICDVQDVPPTSSSERVSPHPDLHPSALWPLFAVIHLPPLPASPANSLSMHEIRAQLREEVRILAGAGFDGIIVENFGDAPFFPHRVPPHTISAMSILVDEARALLSSMSNASRILLGVNVLRNDARAALAIASIGAADFIRVNIHSGTMVTDQGIIEGKAHHTLRYRSVLRSQVKIFADILVKHAHPLGSVDPLMVARETYERGGASALILTGNGTGELTELETVRKIRAAEPEIPLLIGSGLTLEQLPDAMAAAHGAIVGSALKVRGKVRNPLDPQRVQMFIWRRDALLVP